MKSSKGLLLLGGVGQLDIDGIVGFIGGDDIANAVLVGEHVARVATNVAEALADNAAAVDFEQQVRAALQVETKNQARFG
ncbi:hypothetical protein D9M68_797060 [compost metagenome]